jgi:hypothetical protein
MIVNLFLNYFGHPAYPEPVFILLMFIVRGGTEHQLLSAAAKTVPLATLG